MSGILSNGFTHATYVLQVLIIYHCRTGFNKSNQLDWDVCACCTHNVFVYGVLYAQLYGFNCRFLWHIAVAIFKLTKFILRATVTECSQCLTARYMLFLSAYQLCGIVIK